MAEINTGTQIGQLRKWWSDKHKLPPNHHLFVSQTEGQLLLEMYEDLYNQYNRLDEELDDPQLAGEHRRTLLARQEKLAEILGKDFQAKSSDPLIDKWERELAEGKTPNLEERL